MVLDTIGEVAVMSAQAEADRQLATSRAVSAVRYESLLGAICSGQKRASRAGMILVWAVRY